MACKSWLVAAMHRNQAGPSMYLWLQLWIKLSQKIILIPFSLLSRVARAKKMYLPSCRNWLHTALAVCLLSTLFCCPAQANLTYVFSGVGSGTLGASNFTEVPFSITAQGDPTLVTNPFDRIFRLDGVSALLEIQGLGSANFSFVPNLAVNQNSSGTTPAVVISDPVQDRSIFSVGSSLLASYDLRSTFPSIDGRALNNSSVSFPTTRGLFTIESASSASFIAVPEPLAPVWLIVAAAVYRRRR
jgi:hypothetical protein